MKLPQSKPIKHRTQISVRVPTELFESLKRVKPVDVTIQDVIEFGITEYINQVKRRKK